MAETTTNTTATPAEKQVTEKVKVKYTGTAQIRKLSKKDLESIDIKVEKDLRFDALNDYTMEFDAKADSRLVNYFKNVDEGFEVVK